MYTDGSATKKNGVMRAGCGVWFEDNSPFNISSGLRGRQTNNRAELTAIILALRKALGWPTLYKSVTIHSDSKLCVDGTNVWMARWKVDGWTRGGQQVKSADLWKLLNRVLNEYKEKGIEVGLEHVPAHVGVYGNERADRLAKAAVRRAHRNANLSPSQQQERQLENQADEIVAGILANL